MRGVVMDEGMKASEGRDRFISSETGQIVSEEYAEDNPKSTYLRTNFTNGKPDKPDELDPRLTPIIQALEGMVQEPEDYNVAEFYADAVAKTTDLYREVMRSRGR